MAQYTIWDSEKGGPANRRIYQTLKGAEKTCNKMNHYLLPTRYYIKAL